MRNNEIPQIKDVILETLGETCEKIILFGSYAYGTPKEGSGITNAPNDWAGEHKKPRYILALLLSVINVSIQTVDIVTGLPKVKFDEGNTE